MRVGALDPGYSNFGVAVLDLDIDTLKFTKVHSLTTIRTEKGNGKKGNKMIRQNSDDLRRCIEIAKGYVPLIKDCAVVFAEIPGGAKDARAMWAFGAATMAVAFCPVPVIQIQPAETKLATVGTSTASKEEMIEWAAEHYPDAPFVRYPKDMVRLGKVIRKAGEIMDDEEHVCDALAVGEAGLLRDQFLQLVSMWRTMKAA